MRRQRSNYGNSPRLRSPWRPTPLNLQLPDFPFARYGQRVKPLTPNAPRQYPETHPGTPKSTDCWGCRAAAQVRLWSVIARRTSARPHVRSGFPSAPIGQTPSGKQSRVRRPLCAGGWRGSARPGTHVNSGPAPFRPTRRISRFQTAVPECPEGRTPAAGPGSRSPFRAGPEHSGCFCLPGLPPPDPRPADA